MIFRGALFPRAIAVPTIATCWRGSSSHSVQATSRRPPRALSARSLYTSRRNHHASRPFSLLTKPDAQQASEKRVDISKLHCDASEDHGIDSHNRCTTASALFEGLWEVCLIMRPEGYLSAHYFKGRNNDMLRQRWI